MISRSLSSNITLTITSIIDADLAVTVDGTLSVSPPLSTSV
jgi:hypothetical protein